MAGAVVLLRENRCRQALWIFLPAVLFRLLWAGFVALTSLSSDISSLFISLIDCLLIGFVLNWLLAERIGNRNRFVTWLLALVLFGVAYGVTLVNIGLGIEAIQFSIFIGLTVGILLVSFALAGFLCRKKFGPVRFSVWMAVWVLVTTVSFLMMFGVAQVGLSSMSFAEIFIQILIAGLIYGGILITALLPFEIVLFKNAFWRKRFEAVFGLKTKAAAIKSVSMDEPSSPETPAAE